METDCRDIVKACKESGVILSVCHVLRYTPWAQKLKEIIDSGAIGDVVNIQHLEPVSIKRIYYKFHSLKNVNSFASIVLREFLLTF